MESATRRDVKDMMTSYLGSCGDRSAATCLTTTGSETSAEAAEDEALDDAQEVEDGLGTDDEVERRRQCRSVVEITHPQLGPCELPLSVGVILAPQKRTRLN